MIALIGAWRKRIWIMFKSSRAAWLPRYGDALGHYSLNIFHTLIRTGYISLWWPNGRPAVEFCRISLCDILVPELPHKLSVGFLLPLHCSSAVGILQLFRGLSLSNYPENPNHASWITPETLSIHFLAHKASDPQSRISWSLSVYPLLLCTWALSYLEEPHFQIVPDVCYILKEKR